MSEDEISDHDALLLIAFILCGVGLLIVCFIPIASAQLIYKVGDTINLKVPCILNSAPCSTAALCNLSIQYPNSSYLISNQKMNFNSGGDFNYTFISNELGAHQCKVFCSEAGINGTSTFEIEMTGNGKATPEGNIIILFIIFFLIIIGGLVYTIIMSLGHFLNLDFDVVDLSKSLGIYFVIIAMYMMEKTYLGNVDIESWLLLLIEIGSITHVLVPFMAFIFSITVGSLKKQNMDNFGIKRFKRTKL